jgi:uncharacterized membrane protein
VTVRRSTSPHTVSAARIARMSAPVRPLSTVPERLPFPGKKSEPDTDSLRNAMLVTGTAVVGVLTAASLLISALVVRAVLGDRSTAWAPFLVGAGTLAGTLITSWFAQPPISRLVTRIVRTR